MLFRSDREELFTKFDEANQTIGALRFENNFLAEKIKKLSDVELDQEGLFDEANQTIGALRFENNFLAERTKKFEAKLFQVRAQLERTSSAKLDEMLSF